MTPETTPGTHAPPALQPPPDPLGPDAFLEGETAARAARRRVHLLFVNVFVVATCGLVYELVAGAVASYLLGDSVTQFSLVIGLYLSAMGLGAFLSRFVTKDLARVFVDVELGVALLGGLSAPALFLAYGTTTAFRPLLWLDVVAIGTLVGLELPLLMRILEGELQFKELVSRVLAFDYVGALFASILFPVVFVPNLGLVRTALLMGMVNAGVALWGTQLLYGHIGPRVRGLRVRAGLVLLLLAVLFIKAERITFWAEEGLYADPIVYTQSTPYQRIVVTQGKSGFSLWLNGNLQLASADEYRYHEALVHPAMASVSSPRRVLVLGGGDGLAVRELLKHPSVDQIVLVDLDPGMTALSTELPALGALSGHALDDPRVTVVNADAFVWVQEQADDASAARFDVAIVDFPDPNHLSLGKLYTRLFYTRLQQLLVKDGVVAVQSTSPLLARRSFWTIATTMEAAGFVVRPYHAALPSFAVWGFLLAGKAQAPEPQPLPAALRAQLRFLDDATLRGMFVFPPDMARVEAPVHRLDNQALVQIYEEEAARAER